MSPEGEENKNNGKKLKSSKFIYIVRAVCWSSFSPGLLCSCVLRLKIACNLIPVNCAFLLGVAKPAFLASTRRLLVEIQRPIQPLATAGTIKVWPDNLVPGKIWVGGIVLSQRDMVWEGIGYVCMDGVYA